MPHIIAVPVLHTVSAYETSWQDGDCESIQSALSANGLVFNASTCAEPFNVAAVKGVINFHLIVLCIHSSPAHAIP